MWILVGDTNIFGDTGGGPEKRFLFLLTMMDPESRLPGARAGCG